MAGTTNVQQLLLEVDASVELLRRNLTRGDQVIGSFENDTKRRLDQIDSRFATMGRGLTNIAPTIARTRAQVATLGSGVERVEAQFTASSARIKSALLASTAGLAAAFSINQVKDYADGYTRFTNQLKVAGLEGSNLGKVQNDLYGIAQRYGVQLESLGGLYGRLSQGSKELGANQNDLLRFTSGVGAALKIQGGSAESTSGAVLQLTQALGGSIVRAEEFNSINEGARPILQAVANGIDRFGGSVSKLRNDVIAGKLTSREFFEGFLKGSTQLEAQAAKSNLTIGASLTVLNNALGKYIGESDEGLSATARFSAGVTGVANNLDTILPALTAVAAGFVATKGAALGFDAVAAVLARVAQADQALARQVLLGNAQFIDRTAVAARAAIAAEADAAAEVTAIQATVAARQEEAVQLRANLALIAQQRAAAIQSQIAITEAQALGFGTLGQGGATREGAQIARGTALKAEIATKQALAVADAELAIAEQELAVAQTRAAATTTASATATAAATVGARAAAAASALFAGSLTLVLTALPIVAIGLLVAAVLHFRSESAKATADVKAFHDHTDELESSMRVLNASSHSAAGGISQVGNQAVASTGKMLAFAGAVGEAAQKLYDLAKARRHEQVLSFTTQKVAADQDVANAEARIASRRYSTPAGPTSNNPRADADDRRIIALATRNSTNAYRSAQQAAALPLESRLSGSERNGGRDVAGDLARSRNDLKIAQAGGDKTEINRLKAQVYELTQYQAYRKEGASDESARSRASSDAQRLSAAGQSSIDAADGKRATAASKKSDREAAAASRKSAAAVVDEANDTRAFKAAERQANDQIAAAHAELTNSAVERAQIERDRIEADRKSKNEELEQQLKAGKYTAERVIALQVLNDKAAKAATAVVDQREVQRANQEALDLADRQSDIRREELTQQGQVALTINARREVELRLLALAKEDERRRLAFVLDPKNGKSESERKVAQVDQDTLDDRYAVKGAAVLAQNKGVFDQYRDQLHAATDDMNQALEGVEVQGMQNLESGLLGIIDGTESVGSAFKKMAGSIIADLARIAIQKAILSVIPGGSALSFLGLKSGGKIEGRATGGRISGSGTGTSDSILAMIDGTKPLMVSNGESIVTAEATSRYWPIIDAMNKGRLRGLAGGGRVNPSVGNFQPSIPDITGVSAGRRDRLKVDGTISVTPTKQFHAEMASLTFQTVSAAADPIMAGAEGRTMTRLRRPGLPGAPG
jgi:tape measure domain-containing protein